MDPSRPGLGQRVSYGNDICTIRYIGAIKGKGEWLGVEWDNASRGKHDGHVDGERYFTCVSREPTAASFIRPNRQPDVRRSFIEALRYKYASDHTDIVFQNGRPSDKAIQISGKEVEEVGFDKIRKQQAGLEQLKIVLLDGLCIDQQIASETLENALPEIREVCPKIVELDLSRNLLAQWGPIAAICEQLLGLKILRLDGNRIESVDSDSSVKPFLKEAFKKITFLSLEENLLTWEQAARTLTMFPALESLTLSKNLFETLTREPSLDEVHSITSLTLESNEFSALSDLAPLTSLPNLKRLLLKMNNISTLTAPNSTDSAPIFPASLEDVDLSHNSISSWGLVNDLATTFPGLTSLRIARNPLYTDLQAPDGRSLTSNDGYLLTTARLPKLNSLNYSSISLKDALNASSYYLSLIALELAFASEEDSERIKKSHPRWEELCQEYGEPIIKRASLNVNPRSLDAQLLTLHVQGENQETIHTFELPKSLSIYAVLGVLGRHYGLSPMKTRIIWRKNEWEITNPVKIDGEDGLWDSEDEQDGQEKAAKGIDKKMEVELYAGTKSIGDWIEGHEAHVHIASR
ncbi:tubulin-specific chaperone-like protein E [Venturia nashicola]|uniref:Tubulin-specific chaperone-like protein E n=1 Tax=Venturia nashicola TaxID=86259 RepID=A0A4Z1P287_9PEZI|nr:tubulin-specific chaperone-like protein E [Venturia nashicola]TLD34952.1 tubulin-specific chaperone-like protein E [Venturia nashicola]